MCRHQARIQGVGAGARAPTPGKEFHHLKCTIQFKHQSITGRPPLGEILYLPLDIAQSCMPETVVCS